MDFTLVQFNRIAKLVLAFLLSVSVHCEKFLGNVQISVFDFKTVSNCTECHKLKIHCDRRPTDEWCREKFICPIVEALNLTDGVCLTTNVTKQGKCFDVRLVTPKSLKINFSNCEVSNITNRSTNCSSVNLNASCLREVCPPEPLVDTNLVRVCLTCRQSRTPNERKYCLVFVPSSRERMKECLRRTLNLATCCDSKTSRPSNPTTLNSSLSATEVSSKADNNVNTFDNIINFIKRRPIIFGTSGGGVVFIILVVFVCWCRRRAKRKDSANLELKQLPTPSSPLYSEVEIYTYPQFGDGQVRRESGEEYDYAYAHARRLVCNTENPSYVNVVRTNGFDHDERRPLDEEITYRRGEEETEEEYETLSCSGTSQVEEPLNYVEVL